MIKIDINSNGFDVDVGAIGASIEKVLQDSNVDDVYVDVNVVDGDLMQQIVDAYYDGPTSGKASQGHGNDEHPVISFCYREMEDEFPLKDGLEDLGEIILNAEYSGELDPPSHEASEGHSMTAWAEHATLHLIG